VLEIGEEYKNSNLTYKLGYNVWDNKVYPRMEIFKNNNLCSGGFLSSKSNVPLFYFDGNIYFPYSEGYADTIEEMFIKLRKYNEIPRSIEDEYEKIYLLYKLNDFKEL
jgi:hypothetical protein